MDKHFELESALADALFNRLGLQYDGKLECPNKPGQETGIDVLARVNGRLIGIQQTTIDTGAGKRGNARSKEAAAAFDERGMPQVYGGFCQNNAALIIERLHNLIEEKNEKTSRYSVDWLDEVWLLINANLPSWGGMLSSAIMPSISQKDLETATAEILDKSIFHKTFLHIGVGFGLAFAEWTSSVGWKMYSVENADDR